MSQPAAKYDLQSVKLAAISGFALRLFARLLESPLRAAIMPSLLKSAGIAQMRQMTVNDSPTYTPLHYVENIAPPDTTVTETVEPQYPHPSDGFQFPTVLQYAEAYRTGKTDPVTVAQRVLDAIRRSDSGETPLRAMIAVREDDVLAQAEAAARRIAAGNPLSIFDGVPVAVKDEMDMVPYPTTVGTAFLGKTPAHTDATIVARMRAAGALLIGKTNMHEIGIGVTGLNPHYGAVRNPYHPQHYSGGSSSGSAAAVAAGLCPVALGADGGGSIRIPAAFCGVVGLKPTFGRVSEFGAAPLDWSVAHLGPLAATAADAALTYAVIAGPDAKDPMSQHQPPPTLAGWDALDLSDLTLGVYPEWFHHADAKVVAVCEAQIEAFKSRGARVVEVVIPQLEAARVAHTVIIATEMAQAMDSTYDEFHRRHGLDVRVNLALARAFSAVDYVQAQRIRTQTMRYFNAALSTADVIITPSTAVPAPKIPPSALPDGDSDLAVLAEIMRFATPANLTGLPAISFPVGYTAAGMPIGMQAMGHPWHEHTLLRLALAAEQTVPRRAPQIFYPLLD